MKNGFIILVTAWTSCAAPCVSHAQPAPEAARPNILIMLADDLGYADLGVQGSKDIPTPNIDSLAHHGVRCTEGYVSSPMCSPSRAGLITGRSQSRFGHEINWEPDWPLDRYDQRGLPLTERTIADHFRAAGYRTGIIGKWHLGEAPPFHPNRRGFDEFFGFLSGGHLYFCQNYRNSPPVHHYNTALERNSGSVPITPGYLTTVLGDEAAAFIHRSKEKPWMLYTAFNAPHTPMQATPELLARVMHITEEPRRTYAAMIAGMDDAVGAILKQLRDDGLEERTLIFFLSDNGGPVKMNGSLNTPLRGEKGQMWEGGIRVPFIAQWKGILPAGKTYERPVSSLDILPTALAAAATSGTTGPPLDGVDLLPFFTGRKNGDPHEMLFWRMTQRNIWAVRWGDNKLVQQFGKRGLYNLAADFGELRNHYDMLPDVRDRLQKAYDDWAAPLPKPLWTVNRNGEPEPGNGAKFRKKADK